MFQDKNRVVAIINLIIILIILWKSNLYSKINLKITVELRIFIYFVKFLLN
jgi:hypothetical protein